MARNSGHNKYRKLRQSGHHRRHDADSSYALRSSQDPSSPLSMWSYFALGIACAFILFLGLEAYQFVETGGGVLAPSGSASSRGALSDGSPSNTTPQEALDFRSVASRIHRTARAQAPDEKAEPIPGTSGMGSIREDGTAIVESRAREIAGNQVDYSAAVEEMMQYPDLPAGCEPVSLTIVLRALGFDLGLTDLVERYLRAEDAEGLGYHGSPYSDGGGFPPALRTVADKYLEEQGSALRAHDLTGTSFEGLLELTRRGYPVLVWTTMYMSEPQFTGQVDDGHEWYLNEHCVVLYGTDGEHALVSDPLEGLVQRNLEDFKRLYEKCGSMAAYVC